MQKEALLHSTIACAARKTFRWWLKQYGQGGDITLIPDGFECLGWMTDKMAHHALDWLVENGLVTTEDLTRVSSRPGFAFSRITDIQETNRLNRIAVEDAGGDPSDVDIHRRPTEPTNFTRAENEVERFLDYLGYTGEDDPLSYQRRMLIENGIIAAIE
jgi:hypothetical protein